MSTTTPSISPPLVDSTREWARIKAAWRRSPALFAKDALDLRLTPWQDQILQTVADGLLAGRATTLAVPTGHAVGKTAGIAVLVVWTLACWAPCKVVTTAPNFRQTRVLVWREIHKLSRRLRYITLDDTELNETEWRIDPETFAIGVSTLDPTSLQGFHAPLVVALIDEASGVDRAIFDGIDGITTGPRDVKVLIGNPTDPDSKFFDVCAGRAGPATVIQVSSEEAAEWNEAQDEPIAGLVSSRWINDKAAEWGRGSAIFKARVLGEFPEESEGSMIQLAWVQRAMDRYERQLERGGYPPPDEIGWGLDIARHGEDKTVWWKRETTAGHHRLTKVLKRDDNDVVEAAGLTMRYMRKFGRGTVTTDDTGVGGGVTDILLRQPDHDGVAAVNFGSAPTDKVQFADARTEMWWHVKELLRLNRLDIRPHTDTLRDLTAPTVSVTAKGKLLMEPKHLTKKRLGRSPDFGDAVVLALVGAGSGGRHEPVVVSKGEDFPTVWRDQLDREVV